MEDNYFKLDDLDIEYPIHLTINGRKWNFKSDYLKKVKSLIEAKDNTHKLFNVFRELGSFNVKLYEYVPFLVTDDIRSKGDKRTYYVVDYFVPEAGIILINSTDYLGGTAKTKSRLVPTLSNLGYTILRLHDVDDMEVSNIVKYLTGLNTTFQLKMDSTEEFKLPKYFK